MRLPTVQSPIKPVVLGKFYSAHKLKSFSEQNLIVRPSWDLFELPTKHKIAMVPKNILR